MYIYNKVVMAIICFEFVCIGVADLKLRGIGADVNICNMERKPRNKHYFNISRNLFEHRQCVVIIKPKEAIFYHVKKQTSFMVPK